MTDLREKAQALLDLWDKRGSRGFTGEEIADMAEQECQLYRELRAALAEETVCVPREPTEAMIRAGWDVEELVTPDKVYRAMLAARPQEKP